VTAYPFGGTVTVNRRSRGAPDEYGNDTWTITPQTYSGCAWWDSRYGSGTENVTARDTVSSGLTLALPYGTAVSATDQVVIAGVAYEVDGEAGHWRSPLTGSEFGTVVALRRVTG
jgi:hypothetical protein